MDNHQLLREYVEEQSEAAFAELVRRHVDMVYSTALRIVRNPHLAEDVSQLVFIKLARKAGSISEGNALPGWLYRSAHNHAVDALRGEEARRNRENEAMNLTQTDAEPAQAWSQIASDLDDAMQTLSEAEMNAVVLRFFEGCNWRDVGNAMALSEDTAQRRVGVALEKLRAHFLRRGITVSASVLGVAIAANAVQAAPATLGTHLAAGSLSAASGAKGAGLISTIIKTLVAKWQITAAVLTGTAIVGVFTAVVVQRSNAVNAETVRRGLVMHLGFDQEEEGNRVGDDSGRGNHGVVTGAKWNASGRKGGAYEFKTDGDQIEVPNHPSLNPAEITISAWIKTPAPDARWRYIFDKSAVPGFSLAISGEGHEGATPGYVHSAIRKKCLGGGTMVADGTWHQITSTFDGFKHCLYIDGRYRSEFVGQKQSISNQFNLIIGCSRYETTPKTMGHSFRGLIDEVKVFDRELSPREVEYLFTSADL